MCNNHYCNKTASSKLTVVTSSPSASIDVDKLKVFLSSSVLLSVEVMLSVELRISRIICKKNNEPARLEPYFEDCLIICKKL